MYVEKRKSGKGVKFYLVYSYREHGKVQKIRKYLGKNLSKEELRTEKLRAEKELKSVLQDLKTDVFDFSLTKNQVKKINDYEKELKIVHLDRIDWKRFTEEFVYNTNAIEGSTIQLNEVKELLENKKKPEDSEEIETKNVAKAVDFIRETKEELSLELIRKIHRICFTGSKSFAGIFRTVEVVVANGTGKILHMGVPARKLKLYLKDLIEWYQLNKEKFKPLALAAIIHNQFEHIHPFQDGNGRAGRLLLNYILLKNKYPPLNIMLNDRRQYYHVLQEYSKKKDMKPTIKFLIKQYKKTLNKVPTKKDKK
ncbi:Fic family protein [archaeon CG07_land_8_20_14_0_80_38_8]|nr:MAG: Fic family protein [archaeon CG07_land_8_20_14_0_80_38_8]PIU89175.1 MAG: Fic family protein [archaeon CG06_land_8_20_14_3_00_37_11]